MGGNKDGYMYQVIGNTARGHPLFFVSRIVLFQDFDGFEYLELPHSEGYLSWYYGDQMRPVTGASRVPFSAIF